MENLIGEASRQKLEGKQFNEEYALARAKESPFHVLMTSLKEVNTDAINSTPGTNS